MSTSTTENGSHQRVPQIGDLEVSALHININLGDERSEIYPAKQHARQVRDVLRSSGTRDGLIYLAGRPSRQYWEDSDQPPPFRQRRYFYYMSGVNFEDGHLLYDMHRDQLLLFVPRNDPYKVVWFGATPDIEECKTNYDVDQVYYNDRLKHIIKYYLKTYKSCPIYVLHGNQKPDALMTTLQEKGQEDLKWDSTIVEETNAEINTTKLQPAMDASRVIKSDHEIRLIRHANKISGHAHTNVLKRIKFLSNETQVEAIFLATSVASNAKTQAYGIIAASGPNASVLHYDSNDESIKGRQLLCLDAGCEWKCYASDVTRTFPISGKFSKEGQAIYDIVEEMQEECISRIKSGTIFHELQVLAHDIALRGLMKLGILHNGSAEEIRESGATFAFFPHGLGHHIGLEVHDVTGALPLLFPDVRELHKFPQRVLRHASDPASAGYNSWIGSQPYADRQKLLPNMIVTVEPGIYFSRFALENVYLKDPKISKYINAPLLETYYPVGGVRIEDDILVTEDGYENLTTAPKGKAALKIIEESREDDIII